MTDSKNTTAPSRAVIPDADRILPATYVKLVLTAVFWGGTFIAGKITTRHMGPYSAAFLRFAIASIFLWAAVIRIEGKMPRLAARQMLPCLLLGLTGVFSYNVCFFKGLRLIEAGRAAIIIANNPIAIALFSALLFRESLTPRRLLGISISVFGAVTVISRGDYLHLLGGGVGWGELFILGCVASWVAFTLLGKVFIKEMTPLSSIFLASAVGALCLLPAALAEGLAAQAASIGMPGWASLFYLGFFGTVLGFVWYYEGIQAIGPMKAGVFINFVPVSAILLGFLILGEAITPSLLLGAALVLAGVWLTNTTSGFRKAGRPAH
ncbi:MAG: DMT family transporter [Desulfobacterales bacterium]